MCRGAGVGFDALCVEGVERVDVMVCESASVGQLSMQVGKVSKVQQENP